jgi:hypothetical protein
LQRRGCYVASAVMLAEEMFRLVFVGVCVGVLLREVSPSFVVVVCLCTFDCFCCDCLHLFCLSHSSSFCTYIHRAFVNITSTPDKIL